MVYFNLVTFISGGREQDVIEVWKQAIYKAEEQKIDG